MIDQVVFAREMTLLFARFGREVPSAVMHRYHELLSQALSTAQFELAARRAFAEAVWFPSPQQLIDYALGAIEESAELEWLELMRAHDCGKRAELSTTGRSALIAIGGSWALQHEPTDRLRRSWTQSYLAIGRQRRAELCGYALPAPNHD